MASRQESLRHASAMDRLSPAPLDVVTVRWAAGIGGALALLVLVALGTPPERQPEVSTHNVVTEQAQRALDSRGAWLGYTSEADPASSRARTRGLLDE